MTRGLSWMTHWWSNRHHPNNRPGQRSSKADKMQEDSKQVNMASQPTIDASRKLQVVYLADDLGVVQIVIPCSCIIDLAKIERHLDRALSAVSPKRLHAISQQLNLNGTPHIPVGGEMLSLIDKHIIDHQHEFLVFNEEQQDWVAYDPACLKDLIDGSLIVHLSTDIFEIKQALDTSDDILCVHNAIKNFTPLRIQQRLQETLDLPPMPETGKRIIELRVDANATTRALARTVELDPGMSAQVISWARSPYYGARTDIHNVEDAVVRILGFDLVINLALGLSLGKMIAVPKGGPRGYTPVWRQALVMANVCHDLARKNGQVEPGLAYLCGLLSNYGFLIVGHVFPPQFKLLNRYIEANPHVNRYILEQHLLGMTREQITGCLMQQWQMPDEVCLGIRHFYEDDFTGSCKEIVAIMHCASRVLRSLNFGDGVYQPPSLTMLAQLELNLHEVEKICVSVLDKQDEFSDILSLLESRS